jgi:catechol 2,3-dioxygenase-like lactoylglutathione lyase family enzyme
MTSNSASQASRFRWNAVCIDCPPGEFEDVVGFYRDMLGLQIADKEVRWAKLRNPDGGMEINIQAEGWYVPPVWPERAPAQAKMMHFEIRVDDVEAAVTHATTLGAREAPQQPDDRDGSTLRIMLDPAGHPFCLWGGASKTSSSDPQSPWFRWNGVCIDCAPGEFEGVVAFYRDLLGLQVHDKEERWALLSPPDDGMDVLVQTGDWYVPPVWPERVPAQTKMMHFEIEVDGVDAAVARAIDLGARETDQQPDDRDASKLRIMLDPAGHPFCLWR